MKKYKILVVEDDLDIIENVKLFLEFSNFDVFTQLNGLKAKKFLVETSLVPDIIISDIMMPEMDGYEFFKWVSNQPDLYNIPFIFLSALASVESIRFGKNLGVDDYITKPFEEDDLISAINGKLKRLNQSKKLGQQLDSVEDLRVKTDLQGNFEDLFIILAIWDEALGPVLQYSYPNPSPHKINYLNLAVQLYQISVALYGYEFYNESSDALLNIKNLHSDGYIYFNSIEDQSIRGDYKQFMICVVAKSISYYKKLLIKPIVEDIAEEFKQEKSIDIEDKWKILKENLKNSLQ